MPEVHDFKAAPFSISLDESVLVDLRGRLERTRWPVAPEGSGPWDFGASLSYLQRLVAYWRDRYDWRSWETRINRFQQQIVTIEGLDIHVIIEPGSGTDPLPLLLTHGWPGSFVEYLDIIEPLAHPERCGGRAGDGFTVIVPSLPGYGFSGAPVRPVGPADVARLWDKLMRGLRCERYVAHGSDWGSLVTTFLALDHGERLRAIHLTGGGIRAPWTYAQDPLAREEVEFLEAVEERWAGETGYQAIQSTKPLSLSYGLTDSPAGLAAWIVEKFHRWTDRVDDAPPIDFDRLITNIMMHWVPGPGPASWMYAFIGTPLPDGRKVEIPTGFTYFPGDCGVRPPERMLQRSYNLRAFDVASRGGHFPGLENGAELIAALRNYFADFR
jgi:pimeloyl-ACP methyl ester carboxylesterase